MGRIFVLAFFLSLASTATAHAGASLTSLGTVEDWLAQGKTLYMYRGYAYFLRERKWYEVGHDRAVLPVSEGGTVYQPILGPYYLDVSGLTHAETEFTPKRIDDHYSSSDGWMKAEVLAVFWGSYRGLPNYYFVKFRGEKCCLPRTVYRVISEQRYIRGGDRQPHEE